jgi:hypothetical protein
MECGIVVGANPFVGVVEHGLVQESALGALERVLVVRRDHERAVVLEEAEHAVHGPVLAEEAVGLLHSEPGDGGEVVAARQDAHLPEHGVREVVEARRRVLTQIGQLHLLPVSITVHLEEYLMNQRDKRTKKVWWWWWTVCGVRGYPFATKRKQV